MKLLVLLVLIGAVGLALAETDYCSKTLCKNSVVHIACKNSGDFAKSCPSDRKLEKITKEIKDLILKKHNEYRNKLAKGELKGFEPATKMATIKWDDELAKLAEMNVKNCDFEHDKCHNTLKYSQSGQNLGLDSSSDPITDISQSVSSLIDEWWAEQKDTKSEQIKNYPATSPKNQIGHFTAMAREPNVATGCAVSSYSTMEDDELWYNILLACNYASTNIVGKPTYTSGKTASKCETGVNPDFKGLCSEKEPY